jgi:hypothetical protein
VGYRPVVRKYFRDFSSACGVCCVSALPSFCACLACCCSHLQGLDWRDCLGLLEGYLWGWIYR